MTSIPQELTSAVFTDLELPSAPSISPCGNYVVYSVAPFARKGKHAVSALWIAETDRANSARQLTAGSPWNDRAPLWSPDGSAIAFLSNRGGGESYDSCAIHLLRIAEGGIPASEPFGITPASNEQPITSLSWSPSAAFLAFASPDESHKHDSNDAQVFDEYEFNRLRVVQVATRRLTTIYDENSHVYELDWSPDSSRIAFAVSKTPIPDDAFHSPSVVKIISLTDKTTSQLLEVTTLLQQLRWARDGSLYYIRTLEERDTTGSMSVWKTNTTTGESQRHAYGLRSCARHLVKDAHGNMFTSSMDRSSDWIHTVDQKPVHHAIAEIQGLTIATCSSKANGTEIRLVLLQGMYGSPRNLNSMTYRANSECSEPIRLSQHGTEVEQDIYMKELQITTKDGKCNDLFALYTCPQPLLSDSKPKPLPTCVWIHGGPYWRSAVCWDPSTHAWIARILSLRKFAVLMVNYRGGLGYGNDFAQAAQGGMGTVEYDDVIASVDKAIAEGLVDKNRIITTGWSQGGFLSFLGSVRNGESTDWTWKGAICGGGVTDWQTMTMTSQEPLFQSQISGHAAWLDGTDEDAAFRLYKKRASPIRQLGDSKGKLPPMLILHGMNDPQVPVSQAVGWHNACRMLGIKSSVQLVTYPRELHDIEERGHMIDMLDRVCQFVDIHIGD